MTKEKQKASLTFFTMIQRFLLDYMPNQRCMSENTIQSCRDSLNLLLDYMTDIKYIPISKINFSNFDIEIVTGFLNWLGSERHCSGTTINQRLSCIRSFFKYAAFKDVALIATWNRLQLIPLRKTRDAKVMEFMSEKSLQVVLSCPDIRTNRGLRDCFYMSLLYDSAARNSELLNLMIKGVVADRKSLYIIVRGKGGKTRSIPILSKTVDMYYAYMMKFHDPDYNSDEYLFYVLHRGNKIAMSDDNVSRFISKYGKEALGLCDEVPKKIHPHMFRRTRAMHLYRSGMPLPLLSEFLGHENSETTMIYASADTEMKRKAIELATGKNNNSSDRIQPVWQGDDEMIRKLYGLK